MRKKSVFLFLIIAILVFNLSGCDTKAADSDTIHRDKTTESLDMQNRLPESVDNKIKLKFLRAGLDVKEHDYWIKAVKKFNEEHANMEILLSETSWQHFQTTLNLSYASGLQPDIIGHAINSIAERAEKGQYLDLDTYFNSSEIKNDLSDWFYQSGSYNGKLYGLGYYPEVYLWAYRKDYFKEAGLDPEKPPRSWKELTDYAVKLTKRDADGNVIRAGFNLPIDSDRIFAAFLKQAGGKVINNNGEPDWNSPQFIETLNFLTNLAKNEKVNIEITQAEDDLQNLFLTGKAAMSYMKAGWLKEMLLQDPSMNEKIGFMNLQHLNPGVFTGCQMLFISSSSNYKDESWNAIQYFMSREEMWNRYLECGIPVARKSLEKKYIDDNPFININVLNARKYGVSHAKVFWSTTYLYKYLSRIQQEAYSGKTSPEQALEDNYKLFLNDIASTR